MPLVMQLRLKKGKIFLEKRGQLLFERLDLFFKRRIAADIHTQDMPATITDLFRTPPITMLRGPRWVGCGIRAMS